MTRMREPNRSTSSSTWLDTTTHAVRPGAELADEVDEVDALAGVEAVERLVEHEDLGVVDQGGGHLHPLAVALGERAHRPPVARVELDDARGPAPRRSPDRAPAAGGRPRSTNSRGRHRLEQALLLGHEPDAPEQREVLAGVAAEHPHLPLRRAGQADEQPQHGRLAGAVRAEEGGDAGAEGEAHVGDGHHVAEPLRDVVELGSSAPAAARGGAAGRRAAEPSGHRVTTRRRYRHHITPKPSAIQPRFTSHSSVVLVVAQLAPLAVDPLHELERRRRRG